MQAFVLYAPDRAIHFRRSAAFGLYSVLSERLRPAKTDCLAVDP